jgi:hypothetical protein
VTVPVKPQLRQITSCRARAGQHARPSHKHCKPCAKHAIAQQPRARIRLHRVHRVNNANQPVRSAPKLQGDVTVKITKEWKQVDTNAPSNCRNTR